MKWKFIYESKRAFIRWSYDSNIGIILSSGGLTKAYFLDRALYDVKIFLQQCYFIYLLTIFLFNKWCAERM